MAPSARTRRASRRRKRSTKSAGIAASNSVDLEVAYATQLANPESASSARPGLGQVARFLWAVFGGARTHAAYVARMGRLALATQTMSQAERLEMVRSLLPRLD